MPPGTVTSNCTPSRKHGQWKRNTRCRGPVMAHPIHVNLSRDGYRSLSEHYRHCRTLAHTSRSEPETGYQASDFDFDH